MLKESISPCQPTRAYKLQTDMYDTQTGENRWSARKTCTIAGYGDGEKYLHTLMDSFIRGLRRGEQVELHINAKTTECVVPDLFPNVY